MKRIYRNLTFTFCCCLLSFAGYSQVFVNGSAAGANDGSSWADAYTELQDGLDNVAMDGEVWVAAGTYKPGEAAPAVTNTYTFPHNLKLYGGFAGTETMLSERDPAANITLLSGDLAGNDTPGSFGTNRDDNVLHIMTLDTFITAATVISGFTFSGGHTLDASGSGNDRRGGAILSYGAITLSDCIIRDNYGWFGSVYPRGEYSAGTAIMNCQFDGNSGGNGCGLYFAGTANGTVSNCVFTDNSGAQRGAAIYVNNSTLDIDLCSFISNDAETSTGGAIHVRSGDPNTVTIDNSEFVGNTATWGGAVNTYNETSLTIIKNSSFRDNVSVNRAGAIYMGFKARTEIENCEFLGNLTEGTGGAISAQNDTTSCQIVGSMFKNNGPSNDETISGAGVGMFGGIFLDIDECFFEGNIADFGGAVSFSEDSADVATFNLTNSIIQVNLVTTQAGGVNVGGVETLIENCLFTNNVNTGVAGGAVSVNSGGIRPTNVKIVNTTMVENSAPLGAGVSSWQSDDSLQVTVEFQNVIFDNTGNNYEIEDGNPTASSLGGNLSTDNTTDAFFQANDVNAPDPLFVDRIDFDYHLLEGSPCIDAGVDAGAPATDIEGTPRLGTADIGCFEFDGMSSTQTLKDLGTLSIFPNPVVHELNFNFESELNGELNIRITDLRGRTYNQLSLQKNETLINSQLNVAQLASGIYFLNITMKDKNIATRFMKL